MKLSFLNRIKNVRSPQHTHARFFSAKPGFSLYKTITPLGDPKISITPILNEWFQQGNAVTQIDLQLIVRQLRDYRRFTHALEVSTWMTEKMFMRLSPADIATRMNLIHKVHGIVEVENYFNQCSSKLKGYQVYMALLNCYAREKDVENAEKTFQMMKDDKMVRTPMGYNIMTNLYYQTGNHKKMDELMVEMAENGIDPDQFSLRFRFLAYAAASDIAGMDKIVERMESTPAMHVDWNHCVIVDEYLKVGQTDKAVEMLKKIQKQIALKGGNKKRNDAFDFLLKSYARAGMKVEVFDVWKLYQKNEVYNQGYMNMISSLLLLKDVEAAEKIFREWESRNLTYDLRIPNLLIDAYCRNGLVEKAETLVNRVAAKGFEPSVDAWCSLANVHLKGNEITKAKEALKRAIAACPPGVKPSKEKLGTCLEYLEGKGDVKKAEEFIKEVGDDNIFSSEALGRLLSCANTGNSLSDDQVKAESKLAKLVNFKFSLFR